MKITKIDVNMDLESIYSQECSDEEYFIKHKNRISNSSLGLLCKAQDGSVDKFNQGFSNKKETYFEVGTGVHRTLLEFDKFKISDFEKPSGELAAVIEKTFALSTRESNPIEFREAFVMACKEYDYYADKLSDKRVDGLIEKGMPYFNYLKEINNDPFVMVFSSKTRESVIKCCESIRANSLCNNAIFPESGEVFRELPIFGDFKVDVYSHCDEFDVTEKKTITIPFKVKIDFLSIDHEKKIVKLVDLKTTGKSVFKFKGFTCEDYNGESYEEAFHSGSFQNFRYHRQMAFYSDILMAFLIENKIITDKYCLKVQMCVVQSNGGYHSCLYNVHDFELEAGRREYKNLIAEYADAKINKLIN